MVLRGCPLVVEDARQHPTLQHNLAVPDFDVVAYLGVPLITPDGQVLGSFCVIDHVPRRWGPREVATMEALAGAVDHFVRTGDAVRLSARAGRALR